jgi:hypothetical protein
MLLAGTGAVLLVSGIGGQPIGEVLKGSFGSIKFNPQAGSSQPVQVGASLGEGQGLFQNAGLGESPSPTSFSSTTLAPPPPNLGRHKVYTQKEKAKGVAELLARQGITNPTQAQVNKAYQLWQIEHRELVP